MNDDDLPPIDKEIDHLYVTTNWLIATRNSPMVDPRELRTRFINRLREQSNLCRLHHQSQNKGNHFNIQYGECLDNEPKSVLSGEDAFDWFGPSNLAPNRCPVVIVYIHGGYWQAVELSEASHWADPVTNAGSIFVALSYRLAPWQNIKSMPYHLCVGMQKVFKYTLDQLCNDTSNTHLVPNLEICLVGHSAGVQLALEMLQIASAENSPHSNWFSAVKYLVLISGVYDLRPLVHTSINRALKLRTFEEAWAISPLRNILSPTVEWLTKPRQWLIAWAQYDSPSLIKQSEQVAENLEMSIGSRTGLLVETFIVEEADHFTSIEELFYGPDKSKLMRKILEFVGLIEKS